MEDSLDELAEKTETGYNLVVTQENKQTWLELIRDAKAAARKRYTELYSGASVNSSLKCS